jgi:hypothetical protein
MSDPRKFWTPEEIQILRDMHAAGHIDKDICDALSRAKSSVCGMRKRLGLPVILAQNCRSLRHRPDGFAAANSTMTVRELAVHYSAGRAVIERWRKEIGAMTPRAYRPPVGMPADFAQVAPRLTISECAARYQIGTQTARKLYIKAGIKPLVKVGGFKPIPNTLAANDGSKAGVVATWLRSSGGGRIPNVYRATVLEPHQRKHLPNAGKDHYFVAGHGFMSADEMIAFAQSIGFQSSMAA